MKKYIDLFITMLKIGLFTFGGGYAMIALLENEFVSHRKWIEKNEFLDMVAIAESTPGPIAINSATFVGYRVAGFWGAFFATFGVVLPSFVIILLISFVLREFQSIKAVQYAFNGIRAGVLALLIKALVGMYKKAPKNIVSYIVMINLVAFALMGIDKHKAKKRAFRIPEATLFLVAIIGGSIGSILGMYAFRHKTRHFIFVYGMPLILILQIILIVLILRAPFEISII